MAMFVKRDENNTLETTFKEAIKVEKEMLGLKGNPGLNPQKKKLVTRPKPLRPNSMKIRNIQSLEMWNIYKESLINSPMKLLI
jgi:hypothetical protein